MKGKFVRGDQMDNDARTANVWKAISSGPSVGWMSQTSTNFRLLAMDRTPVTRTIISVLYPSEMCRKEGKTSNVCEREYDVVRPVINGPVSRKDAACRVVDHESARESSVICGGYLADERDLCINWM